MPALKFTPMKSMPDDWPGRKCKDLVSGFQGFCVARFEYINGCVRLQIAGTDKDGAPTDFVFDEQQAAWADRWLEGYEPKKPEIPKARTGGPRGHTPPPR